MKVWLSHIFYIYLGNFTSHSFFLFTIPLVNKCLQTYLMDGRVVLKIGFARIYLIDIEGFNSLK